LSGILIDKVVVITGGTRGLGLEIARAYAAEGARVVIASRSENTVNQALSFLQQAGFTAAGMPCDVGHRDEVERLAAFALDTFNRLDIWVNNAAISAPYGPTAAINPDAFEDVLRTNILGVYYGSRIALQIFIASNQGKLINILGEGARGPRPMQTAYSSTKAWVKSFTLALAGEYKATGIGIFAFNPGLMETEFVQNVQAIQGYEGRLKPFITVRKILSQPAEIPAHKAVWLASSATDGKTGLEVSQMTTGKMLAGMSRFLITKITGKPQPEIKMVVTSVPPAAPQKQSPMGDLNAPSPN
jgi:glucose 1-dehydrogenase